MKMKISGDRCILYPAGRLDSIHAPEMEKEMQEILAQNPGKVPVVDASDLSYVSSAGLRVLFRLSKGLEKKLIVREVSQDIYEIFSMTGFTELMDVRKRLRKISTEGCELIGMGGNGTVYRIDSDTIVKVYNPGTTLEKIENERSWAKAAFISGVPTAISFDTVMVDDCYGIVYELLNAKTVGSLISEDPDRVNEMAVRMGKLMLQMHRTQMQEGTLPSIKEKCSAWIDYMQEHYLQKDDADRMRRVLEQIPERNTILHCDFHEGNVMVQGNELTLIDLDDICTGHPVFDLTYHYNGHVFGAMNSPQSIQHSMGFAPELAPGMHRILLETYFGTTEETVLGQAEQVLRAFSVFLLLMTPAKSRDSKYITTEIGAAIVEKILPSFRTVAEQLPEMVRALDSMII